MKNKVLNLAHRGYCARYPENTLLAFRKALETPGCDGCELDVQLSADGAAVIMHDETLDRTTNGTGELCTYTLSELSRLDAGGGEHIPTLDEYFDLMADYPGTITNIELKNSVLVYAGLEKMVIDKIRSRGLEQNIILSSFRHNSILLCKRLAPEIPCGLLSQLPETFPGEPLYKVLNRLASGGIEYLHPSTAALSVELLELLNEKGIAVNTWTANQPGVMRRLLAEPCVRSVITDDPALLAQTMAQQTR